MKVNLFYVQMETSIVYHDKPVCICIDCSAGGQENKEHDMNNEYTAVIKQERKWWIGWIEEVPGVNCQEATKEDLIESLRVTLREALDFNREDGLSAAGDQGIHKRRDTGR